MEKLNMHTKDVAEANIDKIGQLFPNCLTERLNENGLPETAIDFDKLRQELSKEIVEGQQERYQFTWPGKREAMRLANTPTSMTLRPDRESSVNFDDTENLYIEGDNLDTLRLLRESYLGQIKCIYIDPPYNTGKDFLYHDSYAQTSSEYNEISGMYNEEGFVMNRNLDSNGRFHTDWLNMIYPRLKVAKDLLSEDGVIFISIDDNEVDNLRKICSSNELFGQHNFIAQIIVDGTPKNDPYVVSTAHEYCLVYCKNMEAIKLANYGISNPAYADLVRIYNQGKGNYTKIAEDLKQYYIDKDLTGDNISNYKYADKLGVYRIGPIDDPQSSGPKDERINPKTGRPCATPSSGWRCTRATWDEWIRDGLIEFPDDDDHLPSKKTYVSVDRLDVMRAYFKVQTRKDTDFLKRLFGTPYTPFSNPKPVELIRQFIENCNDKNMTILDFFSGSATTFHASLLQNKTDKGNRKCILVQLPEVIEVSSTQSNKEKKISQAAIDFLKKNGKKCNICEIAKERMRRVGAQLSESNEGLFSSSNDWNLDVGFRVFKLDTSNMQDVYYTPESSSENTLFEDNVKPDRTPEDLLFQVMLECNIPLSAKIEIKKISGKDVYSVNDGYLIACFDEDINESVITDVAKRKPYYFIMRDKSLSFDNVADNFEQIFNAYSKDTIRKIL